MRPIAPILLAACLAVLGACGPSEPQAEARSTSSNGSLASTDASAGDAATDLEGPALRSRTFVSNAFHIYRKWKSMEGPSDQQQVRLAEPRRPELLWLTGYRVSIIPGDGQGGVSQEFMCHNNLEFSGKKHAEIIGWSAETPHDILARRSRLFTLSQGQFEVALPEGFGIPVRSDEDVLLATQVLNHNLDDPDLQVRHQTQVSYVRDRDLDEPLKPLLQQPVYVMASLEDSEVYFGVEDPDHVQEGSSCAVGENKGLRGHIVKDAHGREFTGHWIVKPGREVRRTLITKQLGLTADTRVHFIGVHLHPFAESLELRNLTTGESLWTARADGPDQGIGLSDVDFYSSTEGFPLYADHEYELVSTYDNTSGVDQDAMATMFLYLYDEEAAKGVESLRRIARWAAEAES